MKQIATLLFIILLSGVAQADQLTRVFGVRGPKEAIGQQTASLEGTSWRLLATRYETGKTVDALAGTDVYVEFNDGWLAVHGGCNSFSGNYSVEGNVLSISELSLTGLSCLLAEVEAQEVQLLAGLKAAATYAITGRQLQIADAAGETMLTLVTDKSAAIEPINISGLTWSAATTNNGCRGYIAPADGYAITAVFWPNGELTGSAGCNQYRTTYVVDGESMTIQPPAVTRRVCRVEGVMDQETTYLSLLPQVATYTIDGQYLELWTGGGVLVARFRLGPLDYVVVPAGSE
jgi:heat shock protein HslJ